MATDNYFDSNRTIKVKFKIEAVFLAVALIDPTEMLQ
jgi:hypothetical protein